MIARIRYYNDGAIRMRTVWQFPEAFYFAFYLFDLQFARPTFDIETDSSQNEGKVKINTIQSLIPKVNFTIPCQDAFVLVLQNMQLHEQIYIEELSDNMEDVLARYKIINLTLADQADYNERLESIRVTAEIAPTIHRGCDDGDMSFL